MKKLVIISSLLFLIMQINCIKKDFTPTITNVNDEQYMKMVNTTIAELRSWLPNDGSNYIIPSTANWVIQGVIVSSDVNSNFYKCIHIQDSTAGIQLMIDGSGLYASYPVGMRVFVKLAGLGLTTYNNQLELGLVDNTTQKVINIPVKLLDNYIVKGSLNNTVDTLKISDITTLSSIYQSRLVKLSNVIIDTNYAGKKTMGDVVSQSSSYTIPIQDSRKNTVVLSTSPYAIFANQLAPQGAGYIIAVATQYGTDMQLAIRGMEDIHFNPDDTMILNTAIPDNWKIMKISEVRSWKGNISRLPMVGDTAIRGIVVSDNSFVNMPDSQLFIQDPDDNNRAICIFLNKRAGDIKFKHGDEIVVNLKGAVLTSQNAGKVIASFAANHGANVKDPTIVIVGSNKPVDPVPVNLDDLVIDLATDNPKHEAQLVKIENGYFGSRQGQSFSNNIYLGQKDNIQQLTSYTKPAYTGGNLVPNGLCNVTTLVAKYYGGYEFIFRMPTDIEDLHLDPPTVVNPPGCALYEDFDVRTGGSYAGATAVLNSGTWFITGNSNMDKNDKYEGAKSIRLRGSTTASAPDADKVLGYNAIQMNFDKTDGIGSVKFKYGSYSTHSGGIIFVEYSTDGGTNWTKATPSITVPSWATAGNVMLDADIPINISSSVRIRIIKYSQSGSTSVNIDNICIGDYNATPTAVTPTFTPPAGTYTSAQTVVIASTTPLAEIYYTTNGDAPNIGSPNTFLYTTPISVTATTTIKAIAHMVDGSLANSPVATAIYTINLPPVNPPGCALYEDFENSVWAGNVYTSRIVTDAIGAWTVAAIGTMDANDRPNGTASRSLRLRGNSGDACLVQMNFDKTDGAGTISFDYASYSTHKDGTISCYYSINQGTSWILAGTVAPPAWTGSMLKASFPINVATGNVRIKIARDGALSGSSSVNIDNICISDYVPTADMPTFTPPAGTYVVATQPVTISTLTPGASIYYTLNGSNPVLGNPSTLDYATNPINLVPNTIPYTIKAIAVDGSGSLANSNVATATYTIQAPGVVQTPTFDGGAGGGTFTTSKSVVIACATAGATIWYTTNGDDPSNTSGSRQIIASGSSISITQNTTLRAIAEVSGMTTSAAKSAVYTIQVATPTITPASGTSATLPATVTVRISAVTGATIYYTTNGSAPTTSSAIYTGDASGDTILSTAGNITIKAIAVKTGMENSSVASATYTISTGGSGNTLFEDFETGTKTGYAVADVTCTKGVWNLDNALLGTATNDKKNGTKSVRSYGTITMQFSKSNGIGSISLYHGMYGTDNASGVSWILYVSNDDGSTWTAYTSSTQTPTTTFSNVLFNNINISGNQGRIKIVITGATSSKRVNFDDITITDYP